MTFMTAANATSTSTTTTTTTTKPLTKAKKKAKPKLSGKEKKGRLHEHQSCPEKLHCSMESIIEALMDNEGRGVKHVCFFFEFIGLIAPPDLNQAWVNKCLIALVNRELVRKDNTMVPNASECTNRFQLLTYWILSVHVILGLRLRGTPIYIDLINADQGIGLKSMTLA
ncbi:hypothetical protein EDD16DRAFT_1773723 [Pisolithus croceorrhizus]|nr:hypothetical protein EDD16DRAFT_1773723 [Pisolithus croceorrhizus]KAI6096998.1 hypothetical protein EV401DRAFT_1895618 [Pisolithus croceorrhizus]